MSSLEQSLRAFQEEVVRLTPILGPDLARLRADDVVFQTTGIHPSTLENLLRRKTDRNLVLTPQDSETHIQPTSPIEVVSLDLVTLTEAIDKHQGLVYGEFLPLSSTVRDMGVILLQDLTTGLPHYIESAQWQEGKREHTYVSALYTNTGSLNGIFYKDNHMTQTLWPGKSQESDKVVIAKVRPIIASATQAVMNL